MATYTPPKTNISFYTDGTPNGQKISITLEELGIGYETVHVDISKGVQREEWFLRINPNGRIPAIVDRTPTPDGMAQEKRVFEGQAIQLYLAQRYDPEHRISYPFDSDMYWEVVEWMTWLQSGVGPMQGQANHFYRYAPEKIDYAIKRYQAETRRLYRVLERRLASQTLQSEAGPWIVGQKCTIADLSCFSWVNWSEWAGISLDEFPEIEKWARRINDRPAVKRGLDVPSPFTLREKLRNRSSADEYARENSNWIMDGQQRDQQAKK